MYLKQNNQLGAPVWTRHRNQGNSWLRGEVRIRNMKNQYQIVFEGLVGSTVLSDIALDDIRLLPSCPPKLDRFCDFESEDICGYTIAAGDVEWKRGSPSTSNFGPL